MKTHKRSFILVHILLIMLLLSPSLFSQSISGRLTTSLYSWEQQVFDSSSANHFRAYQLVQFNAVDVGVKGLGFHTYLNVSNDFANQAVDDPRFWIYNMYLDYRNVVNGLDVGLGRQKIERIVISPGPGAPPSAGISCQVIKEFYRRIPILGVCLGHQCIGYVFGAKIIKAPTIMHGKTSQVYHNRQGVFKDIESPFVATRYHSLIIDKNTLPSNLEVNAHTEDGIIMGVKERENPLFGVQFHPESILTGQGKQILKNFLEL